MKQRNRSLPAPGADQHSGETPQAEVASETSREALLLVAGSRATSAQRAAREAARLGASSAGTLALAAPASVSARVRRWASFSTPEGQLRLAWGLTILLTLTYIVMLCLESLFRYWTFTATAYDLGNYDQAIWNTLHGHFFEFTNRGWDYYGPPTRLAIHVEPIILPISLLYLIHSSPETLLVLQSIALGLGAIPVFLLARHWMPRWPLVGVVLVVTYLVSPSLLGENLFDFHPVTLATPLLLTAVLAMVKRRYGWFALTGFLAAMCKEDVALAVAMLGIYIAFWQHRRKFGLSVAALSITWSVICFLVIIPHFLNSPQVGNNFWERYAGLGNTPGEAVVHLITQPWLIFTIILTHDKLKYAWNMLLTGGLLGLLFAPAALLPALPELTINMLSDKAAQYSGLYQYNAMVIAFLLVAAVKGAANFARHWEQDKDGWANLSRFGRIRSLMHKRFPWRWIPLWGWWITLTFTSGWAWLVRRISPRVGMALVCCYLLLIAGWNFYVPIQQLTSFAAPFSTGTHEVRINHLLSLIPLDAPVSASDTLNPHLSERRNLYLFPDIGRGDTIAEYIIVDLDELPYENRSTAIHTFDTLISSGQYHIIARVDGVYLAKLQQPPDDSG